MKELVSQMAAIGKASAKSLDDPASTAVELDALITQELRDIDHPIDQFGAPLAATVDTESIE